MKTYRTQSQARTNSFRSLTLTLGTLVAFILIWGAFAQAATKTWTTATDGVWWDATKWTSGTRPVEGDAATIGGAAGTYTVTIDDTTANSYAGSITNLGNLTLGGVSGDNPTLVVNYTNLNVTTVATLGFFGTTAGSIGSLIISNGNVQINTPGTAASLGYFWLGAPSATGSITLVNGFLTSTNHGTLNDDHVFDIGHTGRGVMTMLGGTTTVSEVNIGYTAGGDGLLVISNGLFHVLDDPNSHNLLIAAAYSTATGKVIVAGGTLQSDINIAVSGQGVGSLILSNGSVVDSSSIGIGANGLVEVDGGTLNVLTSSRVDSRNGSMVINGGSRIFTNITDNTYHGSLAMGWHNGANFIVSNGQLTVAAIVNSGDGNSGDHTLSQFDIYGGTATVSSINLFANSRGVVAGTATALVDVAYSGVLDLLGGVSLGDSLASGIVSNRLGGTIQFRGQNTPSFTVGNYGGIIVTNATIQFANANAFQTNVLKTTAGFWTFQGTNTLGLYNATNAYMTGFTFDNSANGQDFAKLRLTSNSLFRVGSVTNNAVGAFTLNDTSVLLASNNLANSGLVTLNGTSQLLPRGRLDNSGTILAGAGAAPVLTTTSLYNQASGVISGSVAVTTYGGMTNAGNIYIAGGSGSAAISGPVTNSGAVRLTGGSSGSIQGTLVENGGTISADTGSPLSITTTTLYNYGNSVITGLVNMTVRGGVTNAGAIQLVGATVRVGSAVTNSGVMSFTGASTVTKSGGDLVDNGNLVFSGASSGTLSNDYLNNGGLISAAADSPVTVVANAVANHGTSAIITGRVTLLVSGGLTNNNVIQIENANLTVGGAMTNSGTVRLLDSAGNSFAAINNSGTIDFSSSVSSFAGALTNNGTVRTINSVGTFNAVVVNNGAWISDPSTNTFVSGYTIGSAGSLSMAAGDVFVFSGSNFVNHSTQSNTYNTIDGKFVFSGGPGATQAFAVAGLNLAALTPTGTNDVGTGGSPLDPHSISYFQNNFALGTLEIAANTTVEVWNASSGSLAGLFLSNLVMGANSALIISNAVQVYYISTNAAFGANVILLQPIQGLSGASGFHELVIPEPSTLLLAGAGLLTLWRVKKKRKTVDSRP